MLLRDAVAPFPDHSFARRVAVVTGITTAIAIGGALVVLACPPAFERRPVAAAATELRIPSIVVAQVLASELALVQRELRAYAFDLFPRWVLEHPARACPRHLLELNHFDPTLHAVDPWGTPYQFVCGAAYGPGLTTRSAGPDRVFDTADDLSSATP